LLTNLNGSHRSRALSHEYACFLAMRQVQSCFGPGGQRTVLWRYGEEYCGRDAQSVFYSRKLRFEKGESELGVEWLGRVCVRYISHKEFSALIPVSFVILWMQPFSCLIYWITEDTWLSSLLKELFETPWMK
jgi:hypothetical protein